jgi:hypothetical protein
MKQFDSPPQKIPNASPYAFNAFVAEWWCAEAIVGRGLRSITRLKWNKHLNPARAASICPVSNEAPLAFGPTNAASRAQWVHCSSSAGYSEPKNGVQTLLDAPCFFVFLFFFDFSDTWTFPFLFFHRRRSKWFPYELQPQDG